MACSGNGLYASLKSYCFTSVDMPWLVDECMTARSCLCRLSLSLKTWWQQSSPPMYWTVMLACFQAAGSLSRATQSCLKWMRHHQKLLSLCRPCGNSCRTWQLLRYLTSASDEQQQWLASLTSVYAYTNKQTMIDSALFQL